MSWFTPYLAHTERCFNHSARAAGYGLVGIVVTFVGAVVVGCVLIAGGQQEYCEHLIM